MDPLGPYALRRRLCASPVGELHEGIERSSGRALLIEIVRDDLVRDPDAREACRADGERLRALRIDGIVAVSELLDADGHLAVVSPRPSGRPLRDILDEVGKLPWQAAGQLVADVGRTLAKLHGESPPTAHLDLRPDRIWLGEDGSVSLLCPGGGRLLGDAKLAAARSVELLWYAPPELLDGANAGPEADLYALGLLLYELLAGHAPFRSSSVRTAINMQCSEPPPPLPARARERAPRALLSLLNDLLLKRPGDRPDANQAVARLDELLPESAHRTLAEIVGAAGARRARPADDTAHRDEENALGDDDGGGASPSDEGDSRRGRSTADVSREAPPSTAEEAAGRELSLTQIAILVGAAIVLAGLLAYCAASGEPTETEETETQPTGRPIVPVSDEPAPPPLEAPWPDASQPRPPTPPGW